MKYGGILFDLDQTLLMKTPSIPQKIAQIFNECGIVPAMETLEKLQDDCDLWIGRQLHLENETGIRMCDEDFLAHLIAIYQHPLHLDENACQAIKPVLMGAYEKGYILAPDTMMVLKYFTNQSISLGIVSNNPGSIRQTLDRLGISQYFSSIILSEEVNLQKPDPAILHLACQQLSLPCERALYIGDHPFDILCAHSAGMDIAWIPPNAHSALPQSIDPPEYRLNSLADLIPLLA